ncbi:hypothetical protein D6C84_10202 [Aureobasidium pullulans]|uniref:Pre-mRNA-splicing factor n=1 Tax=Aureobasidium pullulans TaxID=5580 RepID=A0A4S9X1M2_AURPU|nr:hypothetical protein D6C84_10202 [Aureobasidium pullulans]
MKTSNSSHSITTTPQVARTEMNSLSFSLGGSSSKPSQRRSPPPTKRPNGTKRDHAALLDDASDDEDASTAKRQTITHFDTAAGGAVDSKAPKKEEKKPLVISALANRDWREASKRQRAQKYGITSEQLDARKENAQGDAQGVDKVVKETDAVKYGLNVFAPTAAALEEDTPMEQEADQQEENAVQKTADQLAIDALTGAAPTSTLTIPAAAATEEDAFADSFHSAPPAPSLSGYAAVPVEEYGAAMLRGMGWKGPSTTSSLPTKNGKKPLPPPKRPALLGIGADPNAAAQAEELGAWGKTSSRANGRKEPTMFIPVSMKNKKTGETLTEDELKEKIRRDKEEAENQRFVVSDLEIRDKKRDRKDDGDRDRRRKDEYSDEEERRRRRRDRERDSDRKDREYDRHDKSRNYDREDRQDRKERDRDSRRERSRDRESKRDRDRDHDKSSSRRDRSRDRDHDHKTRDRDYEKSSSRRERYDDDRSERRRRDRDGDGGSYRSSRR